MFLCFFNSRGGDCLFAAEMELRGCFYGLLIELGIYCMYQLNFITFLSSKLLKGAISTFKKGNGCHTGADACYTLKKT